MRKLGLIVVQCIAVGLLSGVEPALAAPISYRFDISTYWEDEIVVMGEHGGSVTLQAYGSTGADHRLERAKMHGFGEANGIGVCNNSEIRHHGSEIYSCATGFMIDRDGWVDDTKSEFDLILLHFDSRMEGRVQLDVGAPGVRVSGSSNFWFGQGDIPDLTGFSFQDLAAAFEYSRGHGGSGHNNPIIYQYGDPPAGFEWDWFLFSPAVGDQELLGSFYGQTAASSPAPDPVPTPGLMSLSALGVFIILGLGWCRRRNWVL